MGDKETAGKTPSLLRMTSLLKVELGYRFKFDDNVKYWVATFLDFRFKTSFLGLVQMERAKQNNILGALKISYDESSS